jgi:hypothetical protein
MLLSFDVEGVSFCGPYVSFGFGWMFLSFHAGLRLGLLVSLRLLWQEFCC